MLSEHSPVERKLRDHPVSPRGDVKYRTPPSSTTLIGVRQDLPVRRPRPDRTGIAPVRKKMGFKTCLTIQGVLARTLLSAILSSGSGLVGIP